MRRPGIWWIGLAAATGLWLALIHFEAPKLESGLAARADAVLREKLGGSATVFAQGRDLRVAGLIFDQSARAGALAALRALPGAGRVEDDLKPPPPLSPYAWRAARNGADLVLGGATPTPAARAALVEAARKAAPGARIVDDMIYASGAPPDFVVRAAALLPALAHLRHGEARLRDGAATLAGEAANEAEYRAVASAAAGLPVKLDVPPPGAPRPETTADSGVKTLPPSQSAVTRPAAPPMSALAPKAAEDCNAALARMARATPVQFENAARLTPASKAPLKALAAAAKACPSATLAISGLSDSASERGDDLSWRRAEAVAAFLLAEGVEPQSLHISGPGEGRPAEGGEGRIDIQAR
ncbi:OmpA family protein [Rhodoblastus acidophilus]|uniref:OmpA family protein n=1 Tax=Candidatus Rhodoblastus alkanivorans TaxID=2954117 RepID=A0ABS9ZA46_9HYPH|nr:OmpA family protein [Candidatus Rhodoblastus alkanivorans]MCI4679481.1 OmpA family protein [Candidatus Rhodoblastus alkanivorans]MCI4683926.1 OmpA family protein [Candidatus Rhodoblastus alkanivorans]MDI4641245.1 OmpA family protein [Rhodoblastus acidophilus]